MHLKSVVYCLCVIALLETQGSFANVAIKQLEEQNILKQILNETIYDKNVRPFTPNSPDGNGPTNVTVNLYIRNMDMESVDIKNREYTLQVTFRQEWLDERLKFNETLNGMNGVKTSYLTLADPSKIWIPDLFFQNANTANLHNLMTPNLYLRIFPNGTVLYSARITLKLACVFVLHRFPFDSQTCKIRMESYGYSDNDIIFHWHGSNPVQITSKYSNMDTSHFKMHAFEIKKCDTVSRSGVYSCLQVDFFFKRYLSKWIEAVYIPTSIIVMVAWIGCWLDEKFVLARIIIGLSSLFALMAEISKLTDFVIPKLPYSTAITPWTDACVGFVLATLVEFLFVTLISKMSCFGGATANGGNLDDEEALVSRFEMQNGPRQSPQLGMNIVYRIAKWFLNLSLSQKCDFVFRILYPIVFFLFACIYNAYWNEGCAAGGQPPESQLCTGF